MRYLHLRTNKELAITKEKSVEINIPYLPQGGLHPRVGRDCCAGLHLKPRGFVIISFRKGVEDKVTNALRHGVAQLFHFRAPSSNAVRLTGHAEAPFLIQTVCFRAAERRRHIGLILKPRAGFSRNLLFGRSSIEMAIATSSRFF